MPAAGSGPPRPLGQLGVQVIRAEEAKLPGEKVPPHPDQYRCLLVEQGSVPLLLDFQPVQVPAGTLLVAGPGQLPQLEPQPGCTGWLLLAEAALVAAPIRNALEQAPVIVPMVALTAAEIAWFKQVFSALHTSVEGVKDSWAVRTEVVPGLLNALLGQAAAVLARQPPTAQHSVRRLGLVREFRQLVRQHYRTHKQPAEYAALLHVTGGYLNDTVKAVTGYSATYFIQQQVLAEARQLLCHSELNSQEVADRLGYADAKYFTRLFGQQLGLTPGQFRRQK